MFDRRSEYALFSGNWSRISIPPLQVRGALSGGWGGMLMSVGVESSHWQIAKRLRSWASSEADCECPLYTYFTTHHLKITIVSFTECTSCKPEKVPCRHPIRRPARDLTDSFHNYPEISMRQWDKLYLLLLIFSEQSILSFSAITPGSSWNTEPVSESDHQSCLPRLLQTGIPSL